MLQKNKIQLFIIDVDGTMTDGGIYFDENGNELKKFCTKDAAGFFALHEMGAQIMVLTGRKCMSTERRMQELHVEYLFQNIKDKASFIKKFTAEKKINLNCIAYIGDDLNDLQAMNMVGYVACPANSCKEIKQIANYISDVNGGNGAVRDIIEHLLEEEGIWEDIVKKIYISGV